MDWAEFCAQNIPTAKAISGEAYEGSGAYGPTFAAAVSVTPCVVEFTRRGVAAQTADAAGRIVVSSVTAYCPPTTSLPPDSRVTLPDGTTTRVLAVDTLDAHGHDIPDHVELALE